MKFDLTKYKVFRNLPEKYKSDKFIKLYMKIYNYTLSIPKDKIVQKLILKNDCFLINTIFGYISCFIEAKDFYNWRNRIYSLITGKIGSTNYRKYELLYDSKAKEKFNALIYNRSKISKENWKNKSKEEKEQHLDNIKKGVEKKYGHGITNVYQTKECKEKCKASYMNNLGVDHPMHSKEIVNKIKDNWKNKTKEEIDNIVNKRESTNLKRYNIINPGQLSDNFHSKFGDEICTILDNALGNPEDSRYAIKNKEFSLKKKDDRYYFYDYCIPSKKLIVEADGCYYHGLIEGQLDVKGTPVEEIWTKDKEKEELAIQNGYKVYRIRDDEYRKDPKGTINKLIEEIKRFINAV